MDSIIARQLTSVNERNRNIKRWANIESTRIIWEELRDKALQDYNYYLKSAQGCSYYTYTCISFNTDNWAREDYVYRCKK